MNITVCLKIISQMQFTDFLGDGGAERLKSGQLALNPADEYALELALRIKDSAPETNITAITMAPQYADSYLRTALAMGADRAVLVSDAAFAGSDTLMTSCVLSRAIAALPPQELIVCGKKALDSETGHIGPQLAARLGMQCVSNVLNYSCPENGRIVLERSQDRCIMTLEALPPLVVTVCNGTGMVRSPSILGLRRSRGMEVELLDARALGISDVNGKTGSGTETVTVTDMNISAREHHQTDDAREGAELLLAWLRREAGL